MIPSRKFTSEIVAVGLVLALAGALCLVLRVPAPQKAAPVTPADATYAPTVAPTEAAGATSTIVTPEGDYASQAAGEQATIVARATADPFPSAAPAVVQAGRPSIVTARRGGLALEVRLPKNTYLSGEAGWAQVTLSNEGRETVVVAGQQSAFWTTLLNAQGREPPPWPWQPVSVFGPQFLQALPPGQSITATLVFHVLSPAPALSLWVETGFSRPSPFNTEAPDNVWLPFEAGPIPLQVLDPAAGQQLQAQFQTDREGWSLRVTDAAGQPPPGPLTGMLEAAGANSYGGQRLDDNAGGAWSGNWQSWSFGAGPIVVRAWVAAPGYVSAIVKRTIEGSGDATTMFETSQPPPAQTFPTLQSAQDALGIGLYRLEAAPGGATLETIQADVSSSSDGRYITTRQAYQLPGGAWLELAQVYANPPYENGGWGMARYNYEAQAVPVAGQPAYLSQHLGWWKLDWKIGDDGFELSAPADAISANDLIALADSLRP